MKIIYQFKPDGTLIKKWLDVDELLRIKNYNKEFILNNLPLYNGYIWRTYSQLHDDEINPKRINQFNRNGELLKSWDCVYIAAKRLRNNKDNINNSLDIENKMCCNSVWRTEGSSVPIYSTIKKIYQHTQKGVYIKTWKNVYEVAKYLNKPVKYVNDLCNYEHAIEGIYNWSYSKNNKKSKRLVAQYDMNGNLVDIWDNAKVVQNTLGYDASGIGKVLKGQQKQSYKYIWKFC